MKFRLFLSLVHVGAVCVLSAAAPQQGEAARGIEKKDIRYLVVYEEGTVPMERIRAVERSLRDLDAALSNGGGVSPEVAQRLAQKDRTPVLIGVTVPGGAGARPIQCPPQNCGCTQTGGSSCSCGLMGEFCFCLLCYSGPVLTPFPEEDPVLDKIILKGDKREMAPPKQQRPKYAVVVVTTPEASAARRKRLAEFGLKTLQAEPLPAGLVIKIKSSPPYHEMEQLRQTR
ncbi:MAG: hypothetical protein WHT08_15685 [Bryobacteraceae bacterium]